MIRHHPETALLLDYAAGSLPEPVALVVATHACMCAECRAQLARLEAVGGALLDELAPADLDDDALAATLTRLDSATPRYDKPPAPRGDAETRSLIPAALRPYVGGNVGDLKWRWKGPTLREAVLRTGTPGFRVSLFRLKPGKTPPAHTHGRNEYTLVLDGSFTEDGEVYSVGDFGHADETSRHIQIADHEVGCVCLAVLDAPVRLRGLLGAIVNPFLRF